MTTSVDQDQFTALAEPLVHALRAVLGERVRVFAFVDEGDERGIGILPEIETERRVDPTRHTLQLRLRFPESAWIDFTLADAAERDERAEAFAEQFQERLPALEAWYEFQLASSSQSVGEPIDLHFDVLGAGPIPNLDDNTL